MQVDARSFQKFLEYVAPIGALGSSAMNRPVKFVASVKTSMHLHVDVRAIINQTTDSGQLIRIHGHVKRRLSRQHTHTDEIEQQHSSDHRHNACT
jgi:hypothetical protein